MGGGGDDEGDEGGMSCGRGLEDEEGICERLSNT